MSFACIACYRSDNRDEIAIQQEEPKPETDGSPQVGADVESLPISRDGISKEGVSEELYDLSIEIEPPSAQLCEGDCLDIEVTVKGGIAPYSFYWDNGPISADGNVYRVCPEANTTVTVTVRDTGLATQEFRIPIQEVRGSIDVSIIEDCSVENDSGLGDTGVVDSTIQDTDCLGVPGGDARLDFCGECDADPTNDCPPPYAVSVGGTFTCGLRYEDGSVRCWGSNEIGQLQAPDDVSFSMVSCGRSHACAIRRDDGQVICWGYNEQEQATPPVGISFTQISAGWSHTCGVRASDSQVQCWGAGDEVVPLTYMENGQSLPPAGVEFTMVSAGWSHSCGIRRDDSRVVCWGLNYSGVEVMPSETAFATVSAGVAHTSDTCGIHSEDGTVSCWGLGFADTLSAPEAVSFSQITVGESIACGLRALDGQLVCWGWAIRIANLGLPEGEAFLGFSIHESHACGVRRGDGQIVCFGENDHGQSSPPVDW